MLNPSTGFYQFGENPSELHLPENIVLSELEDEASVYFDERRIPHIFAKNEHDLYFLQGYVVASLRLWQMEFQVLAAEGRIAEILGNEEKFIAFDKNQRRMGLSYGAKNKLDLINSDPFSKNLLESYTAGVNAYISSLSSTDYPLEYQLIGYQPEEWSAYKTTLLLMNMSNVLTSTEYDIENSNFLSLYGKELFDSLYNDDNSKLEPIVESPAEGWKAALNRDSLEIITLPNPANTLLELSTLQDKPDVQIGSNNWAVSGEKTASGFPLLANDPHLKLSFPSVWIEMHLNTPDLNTYGVVFPGAPGIVIGFNDYIGWGVTNAGRDVKDWYEIEFKDEQKDFYKWEGAWRACTKEIEEIKIKGMPSVFDTVIYTHLGPVCLENFETQAGTKNFALQWMAHQASEEYKTFYLLNRAKNFDDYIAALRYYSCPAQNFVFACVNGDIAIRQQGKFPILEKDEGKFYMDGSSHEAWTEYIPFEDIPMMYNPSRNFVSSANQIVADSSYPYYLNGVFEYYRNRVINEELRKLQKATVEDFKNLQFNNYNLMAAENLDLMLAYVNPDLKEGEHAEVYESLKSWDFLNEANSLAATYFQLFSESYYTLLWDEFVEAEVPGGWDPYKWKKGWKAPGEYQTFQLLQDSVQHIFIDIQGTEEIETNGDLLNLAYQEMLSKLTKIESQEWGKYKNTLIEHLAMIPAFSTNLDLGGNYKIVNATGKFHGPSWRMILDFDGGKIKGIGVYPGGQSGNPGSKYYDNMVQEWATGDYHELLYSTDEASYQDGNFYQVNFKKR
ncbi:MAG: penicillin acylase family protein [Chitinophagales bacterium]|nr:penicillin acylase family protein [Chitinophagales bacterium]